MRGNVIAAGKPLQSGKVILRKSGGLALSAVSTKENSERNTQSAQSNTETQTKIISTNKNTKGA